MTTGTGQTDQTATTLQSGGANIPTSLPSGQRLEQRLAQAKSRGEAEVNRRLATLDRLASQVQQVKRLSADHRTALLNELDQAKAGLSALLAKIQGDSDVATLRADLRTIVDGYRVYVFLVPQVHLIVAADVMLAITATFDDIEVKLQALIDKAAAAGKDTAAAQAALVALQSAVGSAKTSATAVISDVLPLTASGYPGNRGTISSARDKLRAARQSLNEARQQAKAAIDALRLTKEQHPTTTTALTSTT